MATPVSDHDLLIRVATLLDRFEQDLKEIKSSVSDLPDIRRRLTVIEDRDGAGRLRNNALIIATATVISAVVGIIVRLL